MNAGSTRDGFWSPGRGIIPGYAFCLNCCFQFGMSAENFTRLRPLASVERKCGRALLRLVAYCDHPFQIGQGALVRKGANAAPKLRADGAPCGPSLMSVVDQHVGQLWVRAL